MASTYNHLDRLIVMQNFCKETARKAPSNGLRKIRISVQAHHEMNDWFTPGGRPSISKLTVVIYPFAARRDWVDGIPVLNNLPVSNSEEIIK